MMKIEILSRPTSRLVLVLALALAGAAAGQAATLEERAAAIDAPVRGGELTLATPLQIGRATISPLAGAHVRALLAQGTPCGLVIEGPAHLHYLVEDRFSAPVAQRNASRTHDLDVTPAGQGIAIDVDLAGATIWGWGLGQAGETAAGGPALSDWAAKLLAGRRFTPPSHALLTAEANGVSGVRYALLRGRFSDLLLQVDPRDAQEDLYRLLKLTDLGTSFRQGIWPSHVAAQPIGRAWWDRPAADLVVEHERLEVTNPSGAQMHVVSHSRLRAHRAGSSLWRADLVEWTFDSLGNRQRITVRGVRVDGHDADFLHRDEEILVPLGRTLADKETAEVEVTYEGALATRPKGDSYWVLGTEPWYPRRDLDGEMATFEISVDVPQSWTPYASGSDVVRTQEGGRHKLTTRLDQPMQFAVVTAGKYPFVEETKDGLTCRAATYAMLQERAARQLLNQFFAGRGFLEQLLGEPYPFRNVSIVEINAWGFGQAPPGVLFFTQEFYTAPFRSQRAYFQDLNARFLHEVAHGWWGNLVKINSPEENWISEAFSDYTAALTLWQLRLQGRGGYEFNEIVKDWVATANEIRPGASLYLTERLASVDDRDLGDHWRLTYAKGPLVVHALRLELQRQKGSPAEGDRYFIAFLRTYIKEHRYDWGTTKDLVKTLDQLTGGNWQPWFERYVYGTEIPQLPK
jgi:hypothetical protein